MEFDFDPDWVYDDDLFALDPNTVIPISPNESAEVYALNTAHAAGEGAVNKFHLIEGLICVLYQYVVETRKVQDAGELADHAQAWKFELMGNMRVPSKDVLWKHYNLFLRPVLERDFNRATILTREIPSTSRRQCIECIRQYQLGSAKWRYFKRNHPSVAIVMKIINYVMSQETGCSVEFYTSSSSPRSPTLSVTESRSRVLVNYPSVFASYMSRGAFRFNPVIFRVRDMLVFSEVSGAKISASGALSNVWMTWNNTTKTLQFEQAEDIKSGDAVVIWYKNAIPHNRKGVLQPGLADIRTCAVCGSVGAERVCGGCERRVYCGLSCQRADWKRGHEGECTSPRSGDAQRK
jgi:hypothetical protein